MQQAVAEKEFSMPESIVTSNVAAARLAIGVLQGIVLYLLYRAAKDHAWPATQPYLFAPLLLAWVMAPVILISSLGHLTLKRAGVWILAAVIVIAALAWHDIWRDDTGLPFPGQRGGTWQGLPSALLATFAVAGFFIAQALVLAGSMDQRRIARYPTYFEMAWKLFIQLAFSTLFVGALWAVLWLGASLFMLVQLDFLKELLQQSWFVIPVIAFAFSCAMHITDVRPALVRGIRALLLVLLSWLLPLATLMVAVFLLMLPWTGLSLLWETRHATAVLLGAAAALVILINAAFQNGEVGARVARAVRISARLAALCLLPLITIAVYALGLRVGDYGWTTDRISAAACLLVASCYALGYAWAACRRTDWLAGIAGVNVATAFVILAVLLALFSPLADPARLSVNDQMGRLAAGKVGAEQFDFDYLRFDGARYGIAALARLKAYAGADAEAVREKAMLALKKEKRWPPAVAQVTPVDVAANIRVWPATARLPDAFIRADWARHERQWELPLCLRQKGKACDAYPIDFSGDGEPEVLVVGSERHMGAALMMESEAGRWDVAGNLPRGLAGCATLREQLIAGNFQVIAPRVGDLDIAGQRIEINRWTSANSDVCGEKKK